MKYTAKQVSQLLNISTSSVHSRARIRKIKPTKIKGLQMYDENDLAAISTQKQRTNSIVQKETERAIVERYLRTQDNNIAYLCSIFNVSKALVHRIVDEHLAGNAYEIFESKINFPTFPTS